MKYCWSQAQRIMGREPEASLQRRRWQQTIRSHPALANSAAPQELCSFAAACTCCCQHYAISNVLYSSHTITSYDSTSTTDPCRRAAYLAQQACQQHHHQATLPQAVRVYTASCSVSTSRGPASAHSPA
jgi:hypothetical protein